MKHVFLCGLLTLVASTTTTSVSGQDHQDDRIVISEIIITKTKPGGREGLTPITSLPGLTARWLDLDPEDMNQGVGGPDVFVYAKYRQLKEADRVLTEMRVDDWGGDWGFPSKLKRDGWEAPTTRGLKNPGGLTPGSDDDCKRMGMAVKYCSPDRLKDHPNDWGYIDLVGLSITDNNSPRSTDGWVVLRDVQTGCGSSKALNFFYHKTTLGTSAESDKTKAELIKKYCPHLYFRPDERYRPSSVEFFQKHVYERDYGGGKKNYQTTEKLSSPSDTLGFFSGQDLSSVPVYAFWTLKPNGPEIVYYVFYPYNRGKEVAGTVFGNHVGDWEHVTVRLNWNNQPREVFYATHDKGHRKLWADVEKRDGTHPVGFVAWGSHATYPDPGDHTYKTKPRLTDRAADRNGQLFVPKTIKMFNLSNSRIIREGRFKKWADGYMPEWTRRPYRWGNQEQGCYGVNVFGLRQCRLEDGPTGPLYKGYMKDTFDIE